MTVSETVQRKDERAALQEPKDEDKESGKKTKSAQQKNTPYLSLEWKDLRIEVKVCDASLSQEDQEFVELYPQPSEKLLSSNCIQARRAARKRMSAMASKASRANLRTGHTLTDFIEHNQEVNKKGGSSGGVSEDDKEADDGTENDNNKSKSKESESKSKSFDMKLLISLPDGRKQCHICNKIFSDGSKIKRHLMSHSGQKPFQCPLCGWGFYQKCNLDRHLASHTKPGDGEPCPQCDNWFTTKSVLSLHMRDAHNIKLTSKKVAETSQIKTKKDAEETKNEKSKPKISVKSNESLMASKDNSNKEEVGVGDPVNELPFQLEHDIFGSQPEMADKVLKEMKKRATLTCHLCSKTFVKKANLKHHLMLHRGDRPWKCDLCGWRFVQKCNLKKHMESHTYGTHKCSSCDIRFSSKQALSSHILDKHASEEEKAKAKKQKKSTNEPMEAETSIKEEVDVKKEVEEDDASADDLSKTWWKYIDQPASNKGKEDKPKNAARPTTAKKKMASKNSDDGTPGMNIFKCEKCTKVFVTTESLQKHMLIHNSGFKPYACPVCGFRFHLMHNLKRHMYTHEEQGDIEKGTADGLIKAAEKKGKQTMANQTPATAPQSASASKRKPIMTARTPKGGFLPKGNFAAAGNNHSVDDEGNLKCNVCNQWFPEAQDLTDHMLIHYREKPHVCKICGWRFKQMPYLRRHMNTHSGNKPYSCDFCDKSYTDNYSLKQHVAKNHSGVANSLPSIQAMKRMASTAPRVEDDSYETVIEPDLNMLTDIGDSIAADDQEDMVQELDYDDLDPDEDENFDDDDIEGADRVDETV